MSNSLWPCGLQHARLPCPSLSLGVCSNSCPLSLWCHPAISSSVILFSFCLQLSPASGSFPVSWLFASGSQSIGALASASVLPMNIHYRFPLGWLVWSPWYPRDSQEPSPPPQFESINSSVLSLLYGPTYIHPLLLEKTITFTIWTSVDKMMSLLFNTPSRFVIAFLLRRKHL